MRTTLDIDEAVLDAVKELARREKKSAGAVISSLARQALLQGAPVSGAAGTQEEAAVYGFRPLPAGDTPVTNELIERLRDKHGI